MSTGIDQRSGISAGERAATCSSVLLSVGRRCFRYGVLLAMIFSFGEPSTQAQPIPVSQGQDTFRFDLLAGLPSAVTGGVVQDSLGYLWIGTYGGLARYDGVEAEVLLDRPVIPLVPGRRNRILGGFEDLVLVDPFGPSVRAFPLPRLPAPDGETTPAVLLALAEDADQHVWLIARPPDDPSQRRLLRFTVADSAFTDYGPSPEHPARPRTPTCLTVTKDGGVWIGTANDGLYRFEPETDSFSRIFSRPEDPNSLAHNGVLALYEAPGDPETLWVATGEDPFVWDDPSGALHRIDSKTGTISRVSSAGGSPDVGRVWALHEDDAGRLWVGGRDGLFVRERAADTVSDVAVRLTERAPSGLFVTHIETAGDGRLWLGAGLGRTDRRVLLFDPKTGGATPIRSADEPEQATADISYVLGGPMEALLGPEAMSEDRYGTLWVSSRVGLLRYSESRGALRMITPREGLTGDRVRALDVDAVGHIWIGTQGVGVSVFEPATERFTVFRHDPSLPTSVSDDFIQTILVSRAHPDVVWIGTGGQSQDDPVRVGTLNRLDRRSSQFLRIALPPAPDGIRVQALLEDRTGRLWVATSRGVYRYDERRGLFSEVRLWSGEGVGDIKALAEDSAGNLWMGSRDSEVLLYDPTEDVAESVHRFEGGNVNALAASGDGTVWVGSDVGLFTIDPVGRQAVPVLDGGGETRLGMVQHLLVDGRGALWITANTTVGGRGILARLEPGAGVPEPVWSREADPSRLWYRPPAGAAGPEGTLAFGGDGGFVVVDSRKLARALAAPDLVLKAFRVRGTSPAADRAADVGLSVSLLRAVRLRHDQNDIQFDYVGLHTAHGALIEYAFRLDGYDTGWRDVGDRRTAEYYKLRPGTYVFRARARVPGGPWGAERSVRVVVLPPWWRTLTATVLFVLLVLLFLLGIYRSLRQRVIRQERERGRERELAQAREIEHAYAELKATQQQLIQSEKMASLGQLTAGISHEINNPLNFVSSNIEPLKRDIEELRAVLVSYESEMTENGLRDRFEATRRLIEQLDLPFVGQEIDHLLEGIQQGARRTAGIVRSLQSFSRTGAEEKLPANIHEGIEVSLLILSNELRDRVRVVKEYGALPEVLCFPGELNQVFLHVLTNAVEAIEGSGTITIRTWREGAEVKISVRDTGSGIPEAIRGRVFEPFFTTKQVGSGAGLGLSISYGIVKDHGGTIEIAGGADGGAEIVVTLPIEEPGVSGA